MARPCLFVCLVLLSQYTVEGLKSYEDKKTGRPLSITTAHGDVYDCVDFRKQPSFLDPLLNLTTTKSMPNLHKARPLGIGLPGGRCPTGTVPILRTKEDGERKLHYSVLIPDESDHCYAVVRTNDPNLKYKGVGGGVSIYNPTAKDPQWSAARMRLSNGPDSIEAGWMVNEGLFKDNNTHLYIRFVAGGNGCFNLQCSGFVQVGQDVPIGLVPENVSESSGQQFLWRLFIEQHQDDGNWWLSIGEKKYQIGYWPKTLFTSLIENANQVEWGGEVYNPPHIDNPPKMGCGIKPDYDTATAAHFMHATLVQEDFSTVNPPEGTVKYQSCSGMYQVEDAGYQGDYWGRIILFGGPLLPSP